MITLDSADFVVNGPTEDGGLDIALIRYQPKGHIHAISSCNGERVSLLFIHGVSYHKETWIPTIKHLFEVQAQAQRNTFCIVEAWAMDSPNHGRSAVLNDLKLLEHPKGLTAHQNARGVQAVLNSGLLKGTSVIGVAHSASVAVMSLSTLGYATDSLPYSSLIFVEPPIMTRQVFARATRKGKAWEILIGMAKTRKDVWPSRDSAREWMSKRVPWNTWTPRCLDLFVQYALRDLPTSTYPNLREGVTLCCTRDQEAAGYIYHEDGFDSIDRLRDVCAAVPVHCIFGEREDVVPAFVKAGFTDASQGRNMASITTVADAGHLVVQEEPHNLALMIWKALRHNASSRIAMSRL